MLIYFKYSKKNLRCLSILNSSKKYFFSTHEGIEQSSKLSIRKKKWQKRRNNINNEISLQTLGTDAFGAPRSIFVNSNKYKFLFNCGEGTRRIASEYNVDIGRLSSIFFTSNSWENVSGVPVLHDFYNKDVVSSFKAYGPPGLKYLMSSFEPLQLPASFTQDSYELEEESIDCDGSFTIQALPLFYSPDIYEKFQYGNANNLNKREYVLAYICTIPSERGNVNIQKLVSKDVPPGPLVQCLKDGSSVTLPDGRVIFPEDVMENVFKGTTFIVVEVPNFEFLESLVSCKAFHRHQGGANCLEEDIPEVIVHFTPPEVMVDARYRDWVNSFPPSVCHLVLNKKNTCLGLKDTIKMQLQLNQIHSKVFPLHINPGIPFVTSEDESSNEEEKLYKPTLTSEYQFHGPTVQSDTGLQYCIRPHNQFDGSSCPVICPQQIIESPRFKEESFLSSFNHMRNQFESLKSEHSGKEEKFPTILFLGTGSSRSTRTRSVSGILINLSREISMILDCGEGTFGQLVRFLGEEGVHSALRELQLVYISHHHNDHHLGLPTILLERQKSFKKVDRKPLPLYVLATPYVITYLQNINHSVPILDDVILVNICNFLNGNEKDVRHYNKLCDYLNFKKISMTQVAHCDDSFGIALKHNDGWKIVYSGDCMPTTSLADIGLLCDLLIHEATFDDDLEEGAIQKRHSTVSQAITMGKDMKAKNIILNHFSQRYNKIPIVKEELLQNNVGIAFDFMKVTFDDLPYLPYIYPTLKALFHKEFEKSSIRSINQGYIYSLWER